MRNSLGIELRQWAVVRVRFRASDRDEHPAVVISNDEHCDDPRVRRVNLLYGTKISAGNPARAHQVLLNSAEGLEFLTAVDCSYFYTVEKDAILATVGAVGPERRRALKRTIIAAYRLHT